MFALQCSLAKVGEVYAILEKALRGSMTDACSLVGGSRRSCGGDCALPSSQQGLKVLGVPICHPSFTQFTWGVASCAVGWLLLVLCAATRANWLRTVRSTEFAEQHDQTHEAASVLLTMGGGGCSRIR